MKKTTTASKSIPGAEFKHKMFIRQRESIHGTMVIRHPLQGVFRAPRNFTTIIESIVSTFRYAGKIILKK